MQTHAVQTHLARSTANACAVILAMELFVKVGNKANTRNQENMIFFAFQLNSTKYKNLC